MCACMPQRNKPHWHYAAAICDAAFPRSRPDPQRRGGLRDGLLALAKRIPGRVPAERDTQVPEKGRHGEMSE